MTDAQAPDDNFERKQAADLADARARIADLERAAEAWRPMTEGQDRRIAELTRERDEARKAADDCLALLKKRRKRS